MKNYLSLKMLINVVAICTVSFAAYAQAPSPITCNINAVAGNGSSGFSGDGGPAINAQLKWPWNVAVDVDNNLYVSDSGQIRKVDSQTGVISSLPTNALNEHSFALGVDDAKSVYFSFTNDGFRIFKLNIAGEKIHVAGKTTSAGPILAITGNGGAATLAKLGYVQSIYPDAEGNVYIGESLSNGSSYIRKIGSDGIISVVAGNGTQVSANNVKATQSGINVIKDIKGDDNGNLYFTDRNNNLVRKIDSAGIVTTIAGDGKSEYNITNGMPAKTASIFMPYSLAIDENGNIFIGVSGGVLMVDLEGKIWNVSGKVRKYSPTDIHVSSGDGGPSLAATFYSLIHGLAYGVDGGLFIGDHDGNLVRKISCDGGTLAQYVKRQELCDNVDNDFNGQIDDNLTRACSNQYGTGTESCVSGQWVNCTAPVPQAEQCNSIDDDLNGQVDDGLSKSCANLCHDVGVTKCTNGSWSACSAPTKRGEACGVGKCAGKRIQHCTAEGWGAFGACSTAGLILKDVVCSKGVGACKTAGYLSCSSTGAEVCNVKVMLQPTNERCDKIDNDCDGTVDEGCTH